MICSQTFMRVDPMVRRDRSVAPFSYGSLAAQAAGMVGGVSVCTDCAYSRCFANP